MTVQTLLAQGYDILFFAEVETPLLDAMVLLAHALATTKEKILAGLSDTPTEEQEARYRSFLDRRCAGSPVSYIRQSKEFYGLEFYVDERVLVPRPDTETLVEKVLQVVRGDPRLRRVHDACTGSGCIAVALQHTLPALEVSASDISPGALEVAMMNAAKLLGRALPAYHSDMLEDAPGQYDVIVSNPPYLRDDEVSTLRKLRWPEPELALNGGVDGMTLAAKLIRSAPAKLSSGGWLALEAAPGQFNKLFALMDQAGFHTIEVEKDLAGNDRVIAGRLSAPAMPRAPGGTIA
jgi:release factor glutamine methyltransferase